MSRLIRVSFVALLAISAAGAYANVPSAVLSNVPDAITLSPGARFPSNPVGGFTVHVEGPLGPVSGSFVEVEVSPDADVLVSWCQAGTWGGAQVHPILTGFTDANGDKTFTYYGGSCINEDDAPANTFSTFISQVRADGIVLDEPFINSPDAVNSSGKKATTNVPAKRCDLVAAVNVAQVSLSDAVFHTRPIKLGLREPCSKFTPPFNGAVGINDAVFLTPYIKNGNKCNCQ